MRGWAVLGVALIALAGPGCREKVDPWGGTEKPKVLASFAPLYSFAASVAGDDADVRCLMTGTGPHSFEPSAKDLRLVAGADLLVLNGLGLDEVQFEKMKAAAGGGAKQVILGERVTKPLEAEEHDHDHGDGGHDHHHHGDKDPHAWLGIPQAKEMVTALRDRLKKLDPDHADGYTARADETLKKLDELDKYGQGKLGDVANPNIVTFHESMRYFANHFGLNIVDAVRPSPNEEITAGRLGKLVEKCKEYNVGVIAVEPQYPQDKAKVLADELSAKGLTVKVITLDPMETARGELKPAFYFETMRKNIDTLADALK